MLCPGLATTVRFPREKLVEMTSDFSAEGAIERIAFTTLLAGSTLTRTDNNDHAKSAIDVVIPAVPDRRPARRD